MQQEQKAWPDVLDVAHRLLQLQLASELLLRPVKGGNMALAAAQHDEPAEGCPERAALGCALRRATAWT